MSDSPSADGPPTLLGRIVALLFAPFYLLVVAIGLSAAMEIPPQLALVLVAIGAAVIMASLTIFSVKYLGVDGPVRQFRLSTLMLLMLPLSVYLVAVRAVFQRMPTEEFGVFAWVFSLALACLFIAVSTAILLPFAEALWWLALGVLRVRNRQRRNGSSDSALPSSAAGTSDARQRRLGE